MSIGFGVVGAWTVPWVVALQADDLLRLGDAIGMTLVGPTLIWVIGAAVGATQRMPDPQPEEGETRRA